MKYGINAIWNNSSAYLISVYPVRKPSYAWAWLNVSACARLVFQERLVLKIPCLSNETQCEFQCNLTTGNYQFFWRCLLAVNVFIQNKSERDKHPPSKIQDCCEDQYPPSSLTWIDPLLWQLMALLLRRQLIAVAMRHPSSAKGELFLFCYIFLQETFLALTTSLRAIK